MIGILLFSAIATLFVFLAGVGDKARDPRLTTLVLILLALFPLSVFLPKVELVPLATAGGGFSGFPLGTVILGIWLTGTTVAAVRLLVSAVGIARWRERSVLICKIRNIELRQLRGLRGPVAAGVFRPVILVPPAWERWTVDTRRMVLEHELAHHRRRDPLWRWVSEIACVIHGGNPLVIWISRRLAMQCEFACDERVVRSGANSGDYARLLCDLADDRCPSGPVLAMAASSSLETRVQHLVSPPIPHGSASLVVLIGLTLVSAGAIALLGSGPGEATRASANEAELRWSANPFPGED